MFHRHAARWLWLAAGVVCASASWAVTIAGNASPPASLSADDIRAGIERVQAKIVAFRIAYEVEYPTGEGWPIGTYLRRTVAAMSPGSFFHETAHGHRGLPWEDDPRLRRSYISEDYAVDEWVNNRSYNYMEFLPSTPLPGSLPGEFLIHATGLWPLNARPAPQVQGRPLVLVEIARNKQYNVVRQQQERLDGIWCHVLEWPGTDCLWIDVHRGFTLMARESRDIQSGGLVERIELGGHREIKPGIWIPAWIRNTQFDFLAKTPEGRSRRVIDSTLKLLRIEVNEDITEDAFRFHPPPGVLWLDSPDGKPVQTSPGGEEQLDRLIEWFRKYGLHKPLQSSGISKLFPFGCVLIVVAVSEMLVQMVRARGRRRIGMSYNQCNSVVAATLARNVHDGET